MDTAGLVFLTSNCLVALLLAFLIFLMTAYFSLPVRSHSEGWRVARRMLSGLFGRGAPVAFVKEGELSHPNEGKNHKALKLALVDLTSVTILDSPPAVQASARRNRRHTSQSPPVERRGSLRIAGPGLVFVGQGESIRGVTGLRKQTRRASGVHCRTSDGIEFTSDVFVTFSLVQPPAILKVGYLGKRPEDIRILNIDPQSGVLLSASAELEDADKAEVYIFSRSRRNASLPSTDLAPDQSVQEYPPYLLDESVKRRITAAAYYRPLNVGEQTREGWADLPLDEAVRIFRNLISSVSYDELFEPNPSYRYPLGQYYKPRFVSAMRSQGILAYQLVQRMDGAPLVLGQRIDSLSHLILPVQEFTARTTLRDLGIKIVHAGFSELDPGEAIRQQRLENWQARWQQKADAEKEKQDLELKQIKNQARENARQAMLSTLSQTLQAKPNSEKEVALRIIQVLETTAADPGTHTLLPPSAITLLRNLRQSVSAGEQPPAK